MYILHVNLNFYLVNELKINYFIIYSYLAHVLSDNLSPVNLNCITLVLICANILW